MCALCIIFIQKHAFNKISMFSPVEYIYIYILYICVVVHVVFVYLVASRLHHGGCKNSGCSDGGAATTDQSTDWEDEFVGRCTNCGGSSSCSASDCQS